MGYSEALKDGIRISTSKQLPGYYPRCQFCGQEFFSMNYRSGTRYTCPYCRPMKKALLAAGLRPKDDRK